jgi:predicted metal-dependent peptidase
MLAPASPIEKVCVQLLLREPFYGHFLMGVPKAFDLTVPTAAVSLFERQMVKLRINPQFWDSISEAHRYGLVKHEVLHIVLRHLVFLKNYANRAIFNIAADLVVNQFIAPEQLPDGAVTLDFFKPLEKTHGLFLEKDKGVDYYYEKLLRFLQKQAQTPDPAASGEGSSGVSDEDRQQSGSVMSQIGQWLQEESEAMTKHRFWDEFAALDSSETRVMEQFIKNATKQALQRTRLKAHGKLPGHLLEEIEAAVADKPLVNWRRVLRLFAASSNSTFLKNTIRRPSKRYGVVPGIRLNRRHEILLAVDTSGSIQQDDLALFFSEIYHIWRQGARITIVECDADIHRIYPYRGETPRTVAGRGGTSFDAPIRLANERMPDALIYFTDGYAPAPAISARMPVLWVLTNNANPELKHLPGKHLKMQA